MVVFDFWLIEETFIIKGTGFLHDIPPAERLLSPSRTISIWSDWISYFISFHDLLWPPVNFGYMSPFLFSRASHIKLCTDPVSSTGDFDSVVKCHEDKYQGRASQIGAYSIYVCIERWFWNNYVNLSIILLVSSTHTKVGRIFLADKILSLTPLRWGTVGKSFNVLSSVC